MSHFHVDGTLMVAKLKRRLIRGALYKDVAVRRDDGQTHRIGTVIACTDMADAMVPGRNGRFYFYDLVGTKGVHGFRPSGGTARVHFPRRWVALTLITGLLNLFLAAAWLLDGEYAYVTAAFGIVGLVLAAAFAQVRAGAMRAWLADNPKGLAPAELSAAGA